MMQSASAPALRDTGNTSYYPGGGRVKSRMPGPKSKGVPGGIRGLSQELESERNHSSRWRWAHGSQALAWAAAALPVSWEG